MIIKLEITPYDISKGERGNPNKCPVAWSARRLNPKAFDVSVRPYNDIQSDTFWTCNIHSMKGHLSFDLPKEVIQKVKHFDITGKMTPFSFEVEI